MPPARHIACEDVAMPPALRHTVRLPAALDTLVQARVRAGTPFAVLIREALLAYLADPPPTREPTAADSANTVRGLGEQLAILRIRVDALEQVLTRHRQSADGGADRVLTSADTAGTRPTRGQHKPNPPPSPAPRGHPAPDAP